MIFFEKMMMVILFFLKMKEAWSNAPSLKVVFMTLKNLDWSIFEKSDADDDLKKKKNE